MCLPVRASFPSLVSMMCPVPVGSLDGPAAAALVTLGESVPIYSGSMELESTSMCYAATLAVEGASSQNIILHIQIDCLKTYILL